MARAAEWAEKHDLEPWALWWGLAWTAINLAVVVAIVLIASAA